MSKSLLYSLQEKYIADFKNSTCPAYKTTPEGCRTSGKLWPATLNQQDLSLVSDKNFTKFKKMFTLYSNIAWHCYWNSAENDIKTDNRDNTVNVYFECNCYTVKVVKG